MEDRVYSIVELNQIIKRIFDFEEHLHGIMLSGEVTNFKISGSHAYFNLKDNEAQIFCTFFNITRTDTPTVKNGDKVIVRGTPDFYVKGGSLSLKVTKISPAGLGALYLKFIELKEKLEKEGIFDDSHKIAIPTHSKRIGVLTSKTGAVIRDIINVATRRNPFVDIVLFPVKVQGENADVEIARGIEKLDSAKICDVIIVGRGGGSMEDLQPFNTEIVARAVYNCNTPIISAVGHETDFSLCDFAADLRAPTPSAAAELACPDIMSDAGIFLSKANLMAKYAVRNIEEKERKLSHNIDKLQLLGENNLIKGRQKIDNLNQRMIGRIKEIYTEKRNTLKMQINTLENVSPLKMLSKGYAKVLVDSKVVTKIEDVKVDDVLTTHLLNGVVKSKVVTTEIKN